MLMPLLLVGLLLQTPGNSSAAQTSPAEPLSPLLVIEVPQPVATMHKLLQGPIHDRLVDSALWSVLEGLPGYSAVLVGWNSLLAPAAGDPESFLTSLAGDGLYLFLLPGDTDAIWAVVALGLDGDLAQDCIAPLLQLAGIPRKQMRGESWTVALGEAQLMRQDDRFLIASDLATLERLRDAPIREWATHPEAVAFHGIEAPDISGWMAGDLLRVNGYPELPANAGASYLAGEVHEALRTADWVGLRFLIDGSSLRLDLAAAATEELRESHAPFFPEVQDVPMPRLRQGIMRGIFARDLAHWWAARSLYMTERGVAQTLEGESTIATLFGRDPGSEIFLHLENEIRLLSASLPASESDNLSVEYPAGALGFRLKEDAPNDLGQAFANAFFSAVTFANFSNPGMGQATLQMDIRPLDDGRIFIARYPAHEAGTKAPARHNFSPSLLLRDNGELWLSSSIGLLEETASAPVEMVAAHGMWMEFRMPELAKIARHDRQVLVANRMLEEGGDLQAAEDFIDLVLSSLNLVEGVAVRSFLDGDFLRLQLRLDFAPCPLPASDGSGTSPGTL